MSFIHRTCLAIILFTLLLTGIAAEAVLIDRVAGVVDGEVITYSDIRIERIFQLTETNDKDDKRVLQALIDRKLLLREADKFKITENEEDINKIQHRLQEIKALIGEDKYYLILKEYGLTEPDILERLKEKVLAEKFIGFRIHFFIMISDDSIRAYYNGYRDQFGDKSLEDVYGEIKDRLFQAESRRRLTDYLDQLRQRAKISVNL